jgi:uncharacterized protein with WD repeat
MAHDVFISHSSDDKTISDAVCATLEGRGIRCWVAPRDILAGANWGESIVDAITESRVMVLILSSSSNISPQVMREVERAVNKGTVIIPLRVEDIPLSKSLEYFLSMAHWLDAFSGPLSKHLEELANRIEQLISDAPVPDRELTPAPARRSSKRRWVLGGISAATLAIVVAVALSWLAGKSEQEVVPPAASPLLAAAVELAVGKAAAEKTATKAAREKAAATTVVTLKGHKSSVHSVAFSPDSKRIVSGGGGTVKVWDAKTGQEIHTLKGHKSSVHSVAFSPDSKRIVSGGGGTVQVWDAKTGQEIHTLKGHKSSVHSVAFSPDSKRIVSCGGETVQVWDAETGQATLTLKGHSSTVLSVSFSPDGKRIVSSCGCVGLSLAPPPPEVKVWDADTGQQTLTFNGHRDPITSVSFSPDGKRIVSGSLDETAILWNAATGQELLTLKGHTDYVTSVAFGPDGKRIVSASNDRTVKVWDAVTGQEILTLRGHLSGVRSVAFSPDGRHIVGGGGVGFLSGVIPDNTVKIWTLTPLAP